MIEKYRKYKTKYKNLKKILSGGHGIFELDGKMYKSSQTLGGTTYSYYEMSPIYLTQNDITHIIGKENKSKILVINTVKLFDYFTKIYGGLNREKKLYIKWDKVREHYKGFYMDYTKDLYLERGSYNMYGRYSKISWLKHENCPIQVMMF